MIFHCTVCGNEWKETQDKDRLYRGYLCPPCPVCGGSGVNHNDYGDFRCESCGHEFRRYGNGGLHLGCIPSCPECHSSIVSMI